MAHGGTECPATRMHGFDIALDRADEFDGARQRALRAADPLGLELRSVATNVHDLGQDWELMHGLALAATLQLYSPEFGVGLIGSSAPYSASTCHGGPIPSRIP